MAVCNGTLYISAQKFSSHNLALYTTQNGTQLYESTATANDQTSTTPSLVSHNGFLYIGSRTNYGDHKFLYKYATTGGNWTTVDPRYQMGDLPTLVDNVQTSPSTPPIFQGSSFDAFAADQAVGLSLLLTPTEFVQVQRKAPWRMEPSL